MGKKPNILEHNLDYIKDSISRNIGDFQNSGAGYVARLYAEADQADAWFKKDVSRRKYGNYMDYAEKMYFDNQVWTPFVNGVNYVNDLGNYLYPQTNYPDTHLGDVSQGALMHNIAHSMYTYYNTRTENGNQTVNAAVTKRKSITNWVAQCFSLEGYLEKGVRIAVDPMTGFIANLQGYKLTDLQNSDIDDIQRYADQSGVDPWTEICYASKEHCVEPIQRAYAEGQILTDTGVLHELSQSVIDTIKKAVSYNQYNLLGNGLDLTYGKFSQHFVLDDEPTATFTKDDNGIHRVTDVHIAEGGGLSTEYAGDNDVAFDPIEPELDQSEPHSLLEKTRAMFATNKSNTLLARFCTTKLENDTIDQSLQSATSQFGLSHGRNLLKKDPNSDNNTNGYLNPYCRVWTFHHQYDRFNKTIRPFEEDFTQQDKQWEEIRAHGSTQAGGYNHDGGKWLDNNTVLDYKTNLVNITPKAGAGGELDKQSLKRCMFSIENLAWRDVSNTHNGIDVLSADQRGPFGGRIMWFPPYGLNFSEQTNVEYSQSAFIGRGEKVHSYVDAERTGQLSFKLLADHPSIVDIWKGTGDNAEDNGDLLRFFAGCAELNPRDNDKVRVKVTKLPDEGTTEDEQFIRFYVFFPNNYSGINDQGPLGVDFPVMYLLNGVGTQEVLKVTDDGTEDETTLPYDKIYNNTFSLTGITISGDTISYITPAYHYSSVGSSTPIGGYEMGSGNTTCLSQINGVAALSTKTTSGFTVQYSGSDHAIPLEERARAFELIQRGSDKYAVVGFIGAKDHLEISGKDAFGHTQMVVKPGLWCYRIDKEYRQGGKYKEELLRAVDYADTDSFGLNSIQGLATIKKELTHDDGKGLYSLSDIAKAIMDVDVISNLSNDYCDAGSTLELMRLLKDNVITRVVSRGSASSQGHKERNEELAANRLSMVRNWLYEHLKELKDTVSYEESSTNLFNDNSSSEDNSKLKTKLARSAEIRLYYKDRTTYEKQKKEEEQLLQDLGLVANTEIEMTLGEYNKRIAPALERLKAKFTVTTEIESSAAKSATNSYGDEYRFFKKYTPDTKFYRDIKSKISNFYPVFHSVSPEGFNSRLTFLNQCTRQGPTMGGDGNAYNLAFGRPPICILRIGDFYYTKILITSLSVNFDNAPWDLNPEGIGVQPMIADVTMSFKYLGGSSLDGPIARLQNATSFNYYANAGVYDLNAEEVIEYEEDTPNNEVINPANIILKGK